MGASSHKAHLAEAFGSTTVGCVVDAIRPKRDPTFPRIPRSASIDPLLTPPQNSDLAWHRVAGAADQPHRRALSHDRPAPWCPRRCVRSRLACSGDLHPALGLAALQVPALPVPACHDASSRRSLACEVRGSRSVPGAAAARAASRVPRLQSSSTSP
eukprot:7167369-Prymnesium_polylepis.3